MSLEVLFSVTTFAVIGALAAVAAASYAGTRLALRRRPVDEQRPSQQK